MSLKVKSMLITGTNRGIGLEFVKQIVKLPHPPKWLFATCRNPDQAKELQEVAALNSNVKVMKLEVTDGDSVKALVRDVEKEVGDEGLNLLINGAAVLQRVSLEDVSEEGMIHSLNVNCVAPLLLSKACLPLLKKAVKNSPVEGLSCNKAAIINMTSKMGSIGDNTSGGHYAYRASKAALNMISRSLGVDLKPEGILALAIHPGWVRTDMGGPRGLLSVSESVDSLIKVMGSLDEEKAGTFLNYNGAPIEW